MFGGPEPRQKWAAGRAAESIPAIIADAGAQAYPVLHFEPGAGKLSKTRF
jgi:hypothetical protein